MQHGSDQVARERLQESQACILIRRECKRYIIPLWIAEVYEDTPHAKLMLADANTGEFLGC